MDLWIHKFTKALLAPKREGNREIQIYNTLLFFKGRWGASSQAVLEPFIPVTLPPPNTTFIAEEDLGDETLETTTILTPELFEVPEHNGSLIIFDRIYDEGKGKKTC